jgi:hypothetical protein
MTRLDARRDLHQERGKETHILVGPESTTPPDDLGDTSHAEGGDDDPVFGTDGLEEQDHWDVSWQVVLGLEITHSQ